VVDDNSLASGQRQTKHDRDRPVKVHERHQRAAADPFLGKEQRAVEEHDEIGNLTAESSYVTDRHELIGVLDRLTQRLVTTSKFSDAAMELSTRTDGIVEICVQCPKLVIQNTGNHVVH